MRPAVWDRWRTALAHAFAVDQAPEPLAPGDLALLDRLAAAIVARGLAAPAAFFLESLSPLNFLGSQVLHAAAPLLDVIGNAQDAERLATVLERREAAGLLQARIEAAAARAGMSPDPSAAPGKR
jgi:hypothetical protein